MGQHDIGDAYERYPERFAPPPPPARQSRWKLIGKTALVLVGLVLVGMLGAGIERSTTTAAVSAAVSGPTTTATVTVGATTVTAAPAPAVTVTVTATPSTPPAPAGIGAGIHRPPPGQYKTDGPGIDAGDCYFARLRNDSGDFGAIISNNNIRGPASVTVKPGEYLEISGPCVFRKV